MDGKIAFANDCGQMGCKRENYNDKTNIMTPKKRPPLAVILLNKFHFILNFDNQILKRGTSVVPSPEVQSASSSRESAFTFHQNLRDSFLFGKNNVFAYTGDKETPGKPTAGTTPTQRPISYMNNESSYCKFRIFVSSSGF